MLTLLNREPQTPLPGDFQMADYFALPCEDTWIEYLRTRLPYSFGRIDAQRVERRRQYTLHDPMMPSPNWAEYHNFWRRGHVYYSVARLIDLHQLSVYFKEYRALHTDKPRSECAGQVERLFRRPTAVWNALQLEKLWTVVADDHIDRERVVMTNLVLAIELCLKAVKTHAEFRKTGVFSFEEGHNLEKIYDSLPKELKGEILAESVVFAENYEQYRRTVEDNLSAQEPQVPPARGHIGDIDVDLWKELADELRRTTYTAFVGANDPWSAGSFGCKPENWFEGAIAGVGDIEDHRYSPRQDKDEYPTKRIHRGRMLGRFMLEHLFPLPCSDGG